MSHAKNSSATTVNYGDHEIIVPENRLRGAVSVGSTQSRDEDPVARAEKA